MKKFSYHVDINFYTEQLVDEDNCTQYCEQKKCNYSNGLSRGNNYWHDHIYEKSVCKPKNLAKAKGEKGTVAFLRVESGVHINTDPHKINSSAGINANDDNIKIRPIICIVLS